MRRMRTGRVADQVGYYKVDDPDVQIIHYKHRNGMIHINNRDGEGILGQARATEGGQAQKARRTTTNYNRTWPPVSRTQSFSSNGT